MSEHLVFGKDGEIEGLHTIDVEKAKQVYSYWDGVQAIVEAYTMVHPSEMRQVVFDNQMTRESNYNKFGAGKLMGFRHGLSLPTGLHNYLLEYDDEIFTDKKKLHRFMKTFKGLRSCKEV